MLTQKKKGRTIYFVDENDIIVTKVCTQCNESKTLNEFCARKAGLGGRDATCKICGVKRSIAHYEANKCEVLNKARKQREENHRMNERSLPKWRGLVGKINQKGVIYYESCIGGITAKTCTTCGDVKELDNFATLKQGLGGRVSECKRCKIDDYDINKETEVARRLKWQRENPEKAVLYQQRRRARRNALPNDLTEEQMSKTYEYFGGCVLTGSSEIDWDHVIPLATGFGGTTFGNMVPLRSDLNKSKNDANIFEWFERNKERFNLSQVKFDNLIEWLSNANGMTADEYRSFVNGCFENKRNINAGELGSHSA